MLTKHFRVTKRLVNREVVSLRFASLAVFQHEKNISFFNSSIGYIKLSLGPTTLHDSKFLLLAFVI